MRTPLPLHGPRFPETKQSANAPARSPADRDIEVGYPYRTEEDQAGYQGQETGRSRRRLLAPNLRFTVGNLNTSKKLLRGPEPRQQPNLAGQDSGASDEDDPALEEMEQPSACAVPQRSTSTTHHTYSKAVHHDRDRDRRQKHERALPEWRLKQIGRQETQAQQRIKIAQPAAGLDHLQLIISQIDDISCQINGNSKQPDEENAQLRGDQLQTKGQFGVDEIGKRDGKDEKSDRDKSNPEQGSATDAQNNPEKRYHEAELISRKMRSTRRQ